MFKKLSDKFSKGIIYLAAFLVTALMAVMLIHIVKESIPAISQLGFKMFLPSTEWRPVSQKPFHKPAHKLLMLQSAEHFIIITAYHGVKFVNRHFSLRFPFPS